MIAALDMADLNPYVITFGQPSTIDTPCSMLSAERLFRFVNTKVSSDGGITYDPVPFIQGLGADNFGYMIFLGDDSQRVASIGLATRTADFHPNILFGLQAHSMVKSHAIPGYLDRLHNLFNNNAAFPIHANGFENGAICNEDMECQSGKCRLENKHSSEWTTCVPAECRLDDDCRSSDICADGGCISKLQSCMTCQNDADCASGKCLWNLCAGSSGLIDNNCGCKMDTDCTSHRCRFGFCEAKLPIGAVCISSEDCASGVCVSLATTSNNASSTSLLCQDPRKVGFGAVNLVPNETPRLTRATMSWARMLTVVFCCTILTFTIVKRFLSCRRKGYSTIPNAELYV